MHADVDPLNFGIYASSSVLGLSVEHSIHGEKTYGAFLRARRSRARGP